MRTASIRSEVQSYEHQDAGLAIDNDPQTAWPTQQYYSRTLGNKAGIGIYLDANPGVQARMLRVQTSTPGWSATIYGRTDAPPITWPDAGWQQVGGPSTVGRTQDVALSTGGRTYRYYLVWITSLGGNEQLSINEITLYR